MKTPTSPSFDFTRFRLTPLRCRRQKSAGVAGHRRTLRSGMTMIELGVVMSLVTVLLALVLGLSRHVNEAVKLRRAQADLGEWHETLNVWYLKYGMYPDPSAPPYNSNVESNLVWLASTNSVQQYALSGVTGTTPHQFPFSALSSRPLSTIDPWGIPYFYRSTTNAYELLSCGPNGQHYYTQPGGQDVLFPRTAAIPANQEQANIDDLYFEP